MMTLTIDLSDEERSAYRDLKTFTARQHELAAGLLQGVLEQWQENPRDVWVELAPDSPEESSYRVSAVMWAGETWPLVAVGCVADADEELLAMARNTARLQDWRTRNQGLTQRWLEQHGERWDPANRSCVNAETVIDGVEALIGHPDLEAIVHTGTVGVLTVAIDEESLVRGRPELRVTSFVS